jgi:hypothetical protein
MKRISIKARRPSFSTQLLFCVLGTFAAEFVALSVALFIVKMNPANAIEPTSYFVGLILTLTFGPLVLGLWLAVSGWLLFAVLGKMFPFRFSFVCDDTETISDGRENSPNQPPLRMPVSGTPAANAPVAPPPGIAGR